MDEALLCPWNIFRRLQAATDSSTVNARTKGREEALTVLVEELMAGKLSFDPEAIEHRYWTLSANRAAKYRHRRQLAHQTAHDQEPPDLDHEVAIRELARLVSLQLQPDDWRLLLGVSSGTSYEKLASNLGKPVGTLKSQVSRLRRGLRQGSLGVSIRNAFGPAVSHRTTHCRTPPLRSPRTIAGASPVGS